MQEAASPGYLERMEAKAESMKGTTWFWKPEDTVPDRAPDVSTAHLFDTQAGSQQMQRIAENIGID